MCPARSLHHHKKRIKHFSNNPMPQPGVDRWLRFEIRVESDPIMSNATGNTETNDDDLVNQGEQMEAGAYLELALSNRKLWRCRQSSTGIIGLWDPQTGKRYWIDEEVLLRAHDGGVGEANA